MSERIQAGYYHIRAPWPAAPQACSALRAFLREYLNPGLRLAIPRPIRRTKAIALRLMAGPTRMTCRAAQTTHPEVERAVLLTEIAVEETIWKGITDWIRGLS